jgi:hypothetical protein
LGGYYLSAGMTEFSDHRKDSLFAVGFGLMSLCFVFDTLGRVTAAQAVRELGSADAKPSSYVGYRLAWVKSLTTSACWS